MLPLQFALELENSISKQIMELDAAHLVNTQAISLINNFQKELLQFLSMANQIDSDIATYPVVDESLLLGPDSNWQKAVENTVVASNSLRTSTRLWSVYALINKSIQFYQQAAANSVQPQTRLFFNSLSHVKKILLMRLGGLIKIYDNHYWGELGFAPFLLGKD
ncbi:hypothetical protein [Sporomusa acidovorans]|uniref:Uncharacterized protein n=1 Tax=Sporomusa acidovorans (strain ATCC 49682 / DSM 3132 / Mol) TaxID=1123286 RepID=A0ABZ3J3T0_SPOA4|nr:hypothetical protein [Sporomusa acidovorans]OZC20201.1 hypothetical protein SPACI_25990 [Sporomusa acidovorans DSM 3132]SDD42145.1 hypothetical protein SAMN04488499_1001189 [Sporomusa acidovorans]